jgi:cell division protein FtsL
LKRSASKPQPQAMSDKVQQDVARREFLNKNVVKLNDEITTLQKHSLIASKQLEKLQMQHKKSEVRFILFVLY